MNENENEKEKQQQTQPETDVDLAKALKEMKANTGSKEEFEKVRKENIALKKEIIDGVQTQKEEQPKQYDLNELRKKWQKEDQSNLEYIQNTLEYRKALIETGHRDPFLPFGKGHENIDPSEQQKAEHVAEVMQQCIDEADGNSEMFTSLLNARMVDDGAVLMALAKRNAKRK